MVIKDIPIIVITPAIRAELAEIVNLRFSDIESKVHDLAMWPTSPGHEYANEYIYGNPIKQDHNNIIYNHDKKKIMSFFNCSKRDHENIWHLLGLMSSKPPINVIRVYNNTIVPMHLDKSMERKNPIYSIVLTGTDGFIFLSNKTDGTRLVALPGLSEFIMYPTLIQHGAETGQETMDILQIYL